MDTLELPIVHPEPPSRAPGSEPAHPHRSGPRDRPPVGGRVFVGLLGFAALLTTAALLLSDRAPGVLRSMFGDRARTFWTRIDAGNRIDLVDGSTAAEVAQPDFLVHVALWTIVAVLVGVAVWSWRGLVAAVVALAAASLFLEVAQGRYATTRAVEATDAAANVVGIAIGASIAATCYLVWSGVAHTVRRHRSRADLSTRYARSLR